MLCYDETNLKVNAKVNFSKLNGAVNRRNYITNRQKKIDECLVGLNCPADNGKDSVLILLKELYFDLDSGRQVTGNL
jgi:hypothetical protein